MTQRAGEVEIGDKIDLHAQTDVVLHPKLEKNESVRMLFFEGWFCNLYPISSEHKSLMAKHVTPELWAKYKDVKTPAGFTLARAINTGVKNPRSLVGCHAGDLESYEVFSDLFDKVIEDYHGGYKPSDKHPTNMNAAELGDLTIKDDKQRIISTRIRVARNLAGFSLAPGVNNVSEKLEVEQLMIKVLAQLPPDLAGTYYPLDGMTEATRQELIRDHFLFKGNDAMQADSGYHLWFPKGRGIFLNHDKTFLLWINEGDHMRIISMQKGGDVGAVFKRLSRGAEQIESLVGQMHGKPAFLHTDHLGMVTCCPSNLGTGLRGSVLIKLAKFIEKMGEKKLHDTCEQFGLQARGLFGEHSATVDAIYDISNKYRLGHSEVDLVRMMINGVNKIIEIEDSL